MPQCRSLCLVGCRSLQRLTIEDGALASAPDVFGVLELTNTSALRELTVGSNACQCVGELNLNAPELERLFVGKGAFRDASLLRINTAFLKATEKGSMIVEDDAFPMASLIVDGRVGEASRE